MITPVKFLFAASVLVIGLLMGSVCGYRIIRFFFTIDTFEVLSSYNVCEQPLNNRCIRHYIVLRPDGEKADLVPFGGEFEPYYLNDGFRSSKEKFGFSYRINDNYEIWPQLAETTFAFLSGIFLLIAWYLFGGFAVIRTWIVLGIQRISGKRLSL